MSYTRSYSSSINVTGSVSVSYPPSESGGSRTVFYEQNVPIRFDVTVATEPFDKSVSDASLCVDGLTASVAAMNTANCAAIAQCSDQISDSIIKGFYNLVQNDISTKKAENNTVIQTKSALLLEHSKAVQDKHNRMLTDVERERAKFGKVFNELDKELERRITEINKPAFRLSKKVREEVVIKPHLSSAAETADRLGSGSNNSGNIAVAGLRRKVSVVLQNLADSLHNNLLYRHTMRDILWNKSVSEEQQLSYIPVAYFVAEDIADAHNVCKCYVSDNANKDGILASVYSYVGERNGVEPKAIPNEEMKLIDQAFTSMVQDSYSSTGDYNEYQERIYTEICRMWKADCAGLKQV